MPLTSNPLQTSKKSRFDKRLTFRQSFFVGCVGYVFAENAAEKSIKIIN